MTKIGIFLIQDLFQEKGGKYYQPNIIHNINILQGEKYCHPGVPQPPRWSIDQG